MQCVSAKKLHLFFLATDLLFAQTVFGKAVPFATAGDCYSAARCPQVFYICLFFPHYEEKMDTVSLSFLDQNIVRNISRKMQISYMNFISKVVDKFWRKSIFANFRFV